MKLLSKFGLCALSLFLTTTTYTAAATATCQNDVDQMREQITRYGVIESPIDHHRFTIVYSPVDKHGCEAYASYPHYRFSCVLNWEIGNWGSTFKCKKPK